MQQDAELAKIVQDWKPDIVGISAITVESEHAFELARLVKENSANSIVVMGGPHPTSYNEEVLKNNDIDFTILHEGELTFCDLIGTIENGGSIHNVKGIGYRDEAGKPTKTNPRPYIDDLDDIPHPAWDLVNFSAYGKEKSMSLLGPRRVAPIFTSRACPYRCTYCHNMFGKKFQKRSVSNVLDEIEMLIRDYDVHHFEIIDDIFNIDKLRTEQILQGILDRGLKVKLSFPNGLRGDLLNEKLVDLFARAGTQFVSLAIESGSPRIQKHIRKHMQLEKIQKTIRWFVKRRVFTNCFYMLGFPTETPDEIEQTIKFSWSQPSHTAMFFAVTPYKGTELADQVSEIESHAQKDFKKYSYHGNDINLSEYLSTKVLHRAIKIAYFKFLFYDPLRLYRIFRDHPNKKYLWRMSCMLIRRVLFDNINNVDLIESLRRFLNLKTFKQIEETRKQKSKLGPINKKDILNWQRPLNLNTTYHAAKR